MSLLIQRPETLGICLELLVLSGILFHSSSLHVNIEERYVNKRSFSSFFNAIIANVK